MRSLRQFHVARFVFYARLSFNRRHVALQPPNFEWRGRLLAGRDSHAICPCALAVAQNPPAGRFVNRPENFGQQSPFGLFSAALADGTCFF